MGRSPVLRTPACPDYADQSHPRWPKPRALSALFRATHTRGSAYCRYTLSVGWDGRLYDCDFNQMIELGTVDGTPQTIFEATEAALTGQPIAIGPHCFGCTAGAGSSCGGAVVG